MHYFKYTLEAQVFAGDWYIFKRTTPFITLKTVTVLIKNTYRDSYPILAPLFRLRRLN